MDQASLAYVAQAAIPNCDKESLAGVMATCALYPGRLFPMCGLHPTYIREDKDNQLHFLREALFSQPQQFVAVGEIGIDLYWRKDNLVEQQSVLNEQLSWAFELGLPVSIHSRDAFVPCLEVIEGFKGQVKGVFHCFSGSVEDAQKVLELGFYLGIGGNITYKTNDTIKTLREIGLDGVVLETDSPYLAPVPLRGKPNQPAYTRYIAEFLASSLKVSLEEVASRTTANAYALFQLPAKAS